MTDRARPSAPPISCVGVVPPLSFDTDRDGFGCASLFISSDETVRRFIRESLRSTGLSSPLAPSGVCRFALNAAVGVRSRSGTWNDRSRGD